MNRRRIYPNRRWPRLVATINLIFWLGLIIGTFWLIGQLCSCAPHQATAGSSPIAIDRTCLVRDRAACQEIYSGDLSTDRGRIQCTDADAGTMSWLEFQRYFPLEMSDAKDGGTEWIRHPAGRITCEGPDGRHADLGDIPHVGFYLDDFNPRNREVEMRGVPFWLWEARCLLWTKGEYQWPADSGVTVSGDSK